MRALSIAATGMAAQELQLEVVANNIANTNTTGFKRARAEFTDLMYQVERARGVGTTGQTGTDPRTDRQRRGSRTLGPNASATGPPKTGKTDAGAGAPAPRIAGIGNR